MKLRIDNITFDLPHEEADDTILVETNNELAIAIDAITDELSFHFYNVDMVLGELVRVQAVASQMQNMTSEEALSVIDDVEFDGETYTASTEGLGSFLKKIWDAIVKFFKSIFKGIGKFFKWLFASKSSTDRQIEELVKRSKATRERMVQFTNKEIDQMRDEFLKNMSKVEVFKITFVNALEDNPELSAENPTLKPALLVRQFAKYTAKASLAVLNERDVAMTLVSDFYADAIRAFDGKGEMPEKARALDITRTVAEAVDGVVKNSFVSERATITKKDMGDITVDAVAQAAEEVKKIMSRNIFEPKAVENDIEEMIAKVKLLIEEGKKQADKEVDLGLADMAKVTLGLLQAVLKVETELVRCYNMVTITLNQMSVALDRAALAAAADKDK
jgi:hypothetical protein